MVDVQVAVVEVKVTEEDVVDDVYVVLVPCRGVRLYNNTATTTSTTTTTTTTTATTTNNNNNNNINTNIQNTNTASTNNIDN